MIAALAGSSRGSLAPASSRWGSGDGGPPYAPAVGVTGPGESVKKILSRPVPTHPLVVPPIAGAFGVWQVRRIRGAPIGYVLSRSQNGAPLYHCYAHCRDDAGGRPWLRTTDSLNSAVAWMTQHEAELHALQQRLHPEPDAWPR